MAGLEKLRQIRIDSFGAAVRAVDDAARARTLSDTEKAGERARDALTEAVRVTRILTREGEMPA